MCAAVQQSEIWTEMLVSIGHVSLLDWCVVGLSRLLCQAGCLTGQRQGPALKWRSKLSISSSATLARISSLVMRQMQKRHLTQVFSQKSVALKSKLTKLRRAFGVDAALMPGMFFFTMPVRSVKVWRLTVWCLGSVQGGEPPAEDEALPVSLPC